MENWGLLIFDEPRVLRTSLDSVFWTYELLSVVCHEIAHQWVGNLVTGERVVDLSINEGMAVAMEYYCIENLDPNMPVSALKFLALGSGGNRPYPHDGVMIKNLDIADPITSAALAPESDLDISTEVEYARGAVLLALQDTVLAHKGDQQSFRMETISNVINDNLFGTITWKDLYMAGVETYESYLASNESSLVPSSTLTLSEMKQFSSSVTQQDISNISTIGTCMSRPKTMSASQADNCLLFLQNAAAYFLFSPLPLSFRLDAKSEGLSLIDSRSFCSWSIDKATLQEETGASPLISA